MMIERQWEAQQLTVTQLENKLVRAYTALIEGKIPFSRFPSVMLWGPPGVGKSQSIRHIAEKLTANTGAKTNVTDVRLLLFNPIDLRGIPTANAEKTLAVWLKPQIFQMDESPDVVNFLFLDEISAAPPSVQAAAYQITLDRTIGEHKLPENCIVIAAGNRITDKSVAYAMPKALANRLCHIEIIGEPDGWKEWAVAHKIHPFVLGFISYSPHSLMEFDPSDDSLAFPTPRSWEMVSNILNNVTDDVDAVLPFIAGCIGDKTAFRFKAWTELYDVIPNVEDVFRGSLISPPDRPEIAVALASEISSALKDHCRRDEIKNALDFIFSMPMEYRDHVLPDFLNIPGIKGFLQLDERYNNWFMRSGRYWDEY